MLKQTEVGDMAGRVVVETRRVRYGDYETTVAPWFDPDGVEALVFATSKTYRKAMRAHEQAVDMVEAALASTRRSAKR